MTDQPHTPSTERIRQNYVDYQYLRYADNHMAPPGIMQRYAEFDRWLATIETAAEQRGAEQGWDLAIDYAWDDSSIYEADAKRAKAANPYRADLLGDDDD